MTKPTILETVNVSFAYRTGREVLDKINLTVTEGERVAFVGPNGAGKSTLFLHFNAILQPTNGRLYFRGNVFDYSRQSVNRLRQKVGLVFQDQDMQLFAATVLDDVLFGPMNMGLSLQEAEKAANIALKTVEMLDYADAPVHFLSPGQKKRVALAGVLAMEPEVLILDEPTAGLDYAGSVNLCSILEQLHKAGTTLLVSTHDTDWVLDWADQVVAMNEGRVVAAGNARDVLLREDFAQLGFARPRSECGPKRWCT